MRQALRWLVGPPLSFGIAVSMLLADEWGWAFAVAGVGVMEVIERLEARS